MGFKTLTIKTAVYEKLVKIKPKEESFSEFLNELAEARKNSRDMMKFAGAWSKMSEKDVKKIKGSIKELRDSADKNFKERMKRFYE